MKTNFLRFASLLAFAVLFIASGCKKNEEIISQSGDWNIDFVDYTYVKGIIPKIGTANNVGYFRFNPDGTGSYHFKIGNDTFQQEFTYTDDGQDITIINVAQGGATQDVIAISGDRTTDEMTLSGTETHQNGALQEVLTIDAQLSLIP